MEFPGTEKFLSISADFFYYSMISRFLTLDTVDTSYSVCPMYFGMFSIILGFHPLGASVTLPKGIIRISPNTTECPLGQICIPTYPMRTTDDKASECSMSANSAHRPDFPDDYRAFHMHFLFAAAININILICNFGHSLAGKINGGEANILLWDCSVVNCMLLQCQ